MQQVDPADIENQLVKIWDSLQGKNKMRACLFNLIIYSNNDARKTYLQSVAERVIKRFPCRVIFLTEDTISSEDSLKSFVSVMTADEGENAIFCDLIQIETSGKERDKAHFLILPHILPDLPIYFIWGDDPAQNENLLSKIKALSSKTIFDSETAADLKEFAASVFLHRQKTESDIADLNWARVEGWRNLMASLFYCPDKLEILQNADRLDLIYNDRKTDQVQKTMIQALYLQTWIAMSLGWKLKSAEEKKFIYHNGKKHIIVELSPVVLDKVKPGRVTAVNIIGENNQSYHLERKKNHPYIIDVKYSTATLCETPGQYLFDKEESGQSFTTEIFHKGTSKHFLKTLKSILEGANDND
ncbi:MAG: glucose-6-phosphate dehydrogenase assembly protein OpcA [Simkaniaceae bacterium]|nr:glucose-6-phosphate dehydrogenase assembly protein OpcA [Simkaniaceae bacterium]